MEPILQLSKVAQVTPPIGSIVYECDRNNEYEAMLIVFKNKVDI